MDFCNSPASYARFGGILLQVDVPDRAGGGGGGGGGGGASVWRVGGGGENACFFGCVTRFLRKSSGLDLVSQETCSPTLYHLSLRKFRIAHSKFNLGTLQKQLPDCQIMVFHEIHMLRMENLAT